MGKIIKDLAEIRLAGQDYRIELNHSSSILGEREIHIQNESFRMEIPESDFLHMLATIRLAKKQLEQIKGKKKLKDLEV